MDRSEHIHESPRRVGPCLPVPLNLLATQLEPQTPKVLSHHTHRERLEPRVQRGLVTELLPAFLRLDPRALDVLVPDARSILRHLDGVRRRARRHGPGAPAE